MTSAGSRAGVSTRVREPMAMMLQGKAAVITGGSRGIGEGAVRLFVEHGCRVVVADILDEDGQRLAAELGEAVFFQHCDVTVEADIQRCVDECVARFGGIDIMFNNAGFPGTSVSVEDIDADQW